MDKYRQCSCNYSTFQLTPLNTKVTFTHAGHIGLKTCEIDGIKKIDRTSQVKIQWEMLGNLTS